MWHLVSVEKEFGMSEVVAQPVTGSIEVTDEDARVPAERSQRNEHGMVSAEWAVGLIAAIAIAGVLLAVVTTGSVKSALLKFILLVIEAFAGKL